ncbi:MAG: hypothetical protein JWM11_1330 [Planctomycetaceae bacterium]|nr:hypothetical protein [Planctomycetaceae bacterium]
MIPEFEYRAMVFFILSGMVAWAVLVCSSIYVVVRY